MSDTKREQLALNTIQSKLTEAAQRAESGQPGTSQPLTPVTRRKRWYFLILIALILLGAIPIIGYLRQSETAKKFEGLGLAFCAIAWGGLLIRHLVQVLEEEDKFDLAQLNANQATVPSTDSNPTVQQTNLTAPPLEAGQNIE